MLRFTCHPIKWGLSRASYTARSAVGNVQSVSPFSGYLQQQSPQQRQQRMFSTIIPERNLWDTIYSGTKGLWSLLMSEDSRQKFMDTVQESAVINADVLKQARFGSLLTMALFHDLQDPLFEKYKFDAGDFLQGVQPALLNLHATLGQLQNEFPLLTSKEERAEKMAQRVQQLFARSIHHSIAASNQNVSSDSDEEKTLADNVWIEQAQMDATSAAGRLQKMVVPWIFDDLFLKTETDAMWANYQDGSIRISNVALISARAVVVEDDSDDDEKPEKFVTTKSASHTEKSSDGHKTMESVGVTTKAEVESSSDAKEDTSLAKIKSSEKQEISEEEQTATKKAFIPKADENSSEAAKDDAMLSSQQASSEEDTTPVAAQIEVLYEMNQTLEVKPELLDEARKELVDDKGFSSEDAEKLNTTHDEFKLWIGTFEGWLNGGPDKALRWRLTNLRAPTADFPRT